MLLAASLATRRADAAAVIAAAIEANVLRGQGHRKIAAVLGRPVCTVRGWLRAFTCSAEAITAAFTALVLRDAPDAAAVWPAPHRGAGVQALVALGAYAAAVADRFAVGTLAWVRAGIVASHGRLFSGPWWAGTGQHELTLTPVLADTSGSR